jgi:hypothetical protein
MCKPWENYGNLMKTPFLATKMAWAVLSCHPGRRTGVPWRPCPATRDAAGIGSRATRRWFLGLRVCKDMLWVTMMVYVAVCGLILVISGLCLLCLLFSDLGCLACRSFQDHERNSVRHSKTTLFFWDGNHSRATASTAWMAGYQVRRCYLYELLMAYSKKLAYQPSKSGTIKASRLRCGW